MTLSGTLSANDHCPRLAAAASASLAWAVGSSAATHGTLAVHEAVLVEVAVLGALAAAVGIHRTDRFEARLGAFVLALVVVVGQLAVATAGAPDGSSGSWSRDALGVVAAGCLAAVLAAWDARACVDSPEVVRPYAR